MPRLGSCPGALEPRRVGIDLVSRVKADADATGLQGDEPSLCGNAPRREEKRREEGRREEGRRKREAAVRRKTSPEKVSTEEKKRPEGKARAAGSRYIPSSVRERVLERACYQCEFTGTGGVRCSSRTGLEIDHPTPYVKGGGVGEENLRALCRAHNLFSATQEFGVEFMRGKIEGNVESPSSILFSA